MGSSTPSVSPLRQRMIDDMRMRKFDGKTQIHYIRAVRRLTAFLKRSPDTATAEDLRAFQLHMVETGTSLNGRVNEIVLVLQMETCCIQQCIQLCQTRLHFLWVVQIQTTKAMQRVGHEQAQGFVDGRIDVVAGCGAHGEWKSSGS